MLVSSPDGMHTTISGVAVGVLAGACAGAGVGVRVGVGVSFGAAVGAAAGEGEGVGAGAGVAVEPGVGVGGCVGMTPGTGVAVASSWAIVGVAKGVAVASSWATVGEGKGVAVASGCEQATRSSPISANKKDASRMVPGTVTPAEYMSWSFLCYCSVGTFPSQGHTWSKLLSIWIAARDANPTPACPYPLRQLTGTRSSVDDLLFPKRGFNNQGES